MTIPSGATTWQSDPNWSPTSPTRSKTTPAKVTAQPVWAATGKPPEHRPHRRNRSVAGRQRHQSPRPATNRRNPTRNAPGPVETTPRPAYRPCHRPASRCEGRRATGRTHRTQSQATTGSARTKNPNGVRAGRPRPADSTPQSSDRGARNMRLHSTRRWQAGSRTGSCLGSVGP